MASHVPTSIRALPARERSRLDTAVRPVRRSARSLDDDTTEVVRVIEFLWIGTQGVQPVLMLQRDLLH